MPARLHPLPQAEADAVFARLDRAADGGEAGAAEAADSDVIRSAVKHLLALLVQRYPGTSVEVRVPPYAAVQCIEGARHTRGTPPAVVETDAMTWIALARGQVDFAVAVHDGRVRASGERSDLSAQLPVV
ncbi:MAG: sterol carrier family protein [Nocardioidaceae bacterium]